MKQQLKQQQQQMLSPFGESLFFACAKKSNQKKAHPAYAPPSGVRGTGGIFRRDILSRRKTARIHARRPCGVLPAGSAAPTGAPIDQKLNSNSNSNDKGEFHAA
ncbi:MAG: hypothetical protein QM581_04300 [Pseudomonas sp.]